MEGERAASFDAEFEVFERQVLSSFDLELYGNV